MELLFTLLILFQIKHFICDYPLQGKYMLGKFKPGWDFLTPLLFHVAVHGYFTFAICLFTTSKLSFSFAIAALDMFIHFFMDRIKAGPKYLGRFKDMMDKKFWWSLGLDQMVHHFTHYLLIYLIIKKIKGV